MTTAYVTHLRFTEHDLPRHPENAQRIRSVWQHLETNGLTERMLAVPATPVEESLIRMVHDRAHLEILEATTHRSQLTMIDHDTYATPYSLEVATLSAGGVVEAVRAVLSGSAHNALAAVRPPGHHAMPAYPMGFCLLGNIAIAARYAQAAYQIKRIMIVDFDVHHGNGTEAMFYDDDSVLFISVHQYGRRFYPGTGAINDIGTGKGEGYNINIPLLGEHGDHNYAKVFERVVWPAAERYQPELILVSAGFDAHWTDPLASMRLSLTGYAHLTNELIRMAQQLCGGKIVFVMEGGYDLDVLGNGWCNVAHALLGDAVVSDPMGQDGIGEEADVTALIERIRAIHSL